MALDANRIRKTVRKLRTVMKKAPKRATVEQVHRLRTDIRRLEAAFETLSPNPRRSGRPPAPRSRAHSQACRQNPRHGCPDRCPDTLASEPSAEARANVQAVSQGKAWRRHDTSDGYYWESPRTGWSSRLCIGEDSNGGGCRAFTPIFLKFKQDSISAAPR